MQWILIWSGTNNITKEWCWGCGRAVHSHRAAKTARKAEVIYAEVTFIQLPVVILHCFLLIEMFEFGHNRTQPLGFRPAGSQAMDAVEGDILHSVPQKLQVGLDEGFNCNFCILLR